MSPRHRSDDPIHQSETDAAPVELTVIAGDPDPRELAAVTAVLTAIAQESDDRALLAARPTRSAWQRSQVAVRQPLQSGRGGWIDATRS